MGDLLLHSSKHVHLKYIEDLLKALLKNCLKISPRKCQLIRTEVQCKDNSIFIKDKRVPVKPLKQGCNQPKI